MVVNLDGVMWTQQMHILERFILKKNAIANMMVYLASFVRCLCHRLALINALAMDIAVEDFVK